MQSVIGVDEVGRGCWAGPLVAGAVLLDHDIPSLADSKTLSRKQRERLETEIMTQAVAYGLGWVWPKEVDELGLTAATSKAMSAALAKLGIDCPIGQSISQVVIDGNINYLCSCKDKPCKEGFEAKVKADAIVPAVSAASILAKVARDRYMRDIAAAYPKYQFEKHVGYGTSLHRQLLELHGVSELHRRSYKPIALLLN